MIEKKLSGDKYYGTNRFGKGTVKKYIHKFFIGCRYFV